MEKYHKTHNALKTPQTEKIPGSNQVENSAGGYVFSVDCWKRLERFLILGADGPTYYIGKKQLVQENAQAVQQCIDTDGVLTVGKIMDVSDQGRAPKNDPAIFALAMCAGAKDESTRLAALMALPVVCRIPTHLFHFLEYCKGFRGWGRSMRKYVAKWYNDKPLKQLVYHSIKYRQRDGWSNRDALRKSHPKTEDPIRNALFKWIVRKGEVGRNEINFGSLDEFGDLNLLRHFGLMQKAETEKDVLYALRQSEGNLPWETVPTQFLKSPKVWDSLLPNLPMTALIRNLGRMTANGLIVTGSQAVKTIRAKLRDETSIQKSRIHPLNVLVGMKTYQNGHGFKGKLTWSPNRSVVDAMDDLFYAAFRNVKPTGKNLVLALDVSGSMGHAISTTPILSCREAAAAMAMVTARTEEDYAIVGFSDTLIELDISPRQRLDDVIKEISGLPFSRTDCSLPMMWALGAKIQRAQSFGGMWGQPRGSGRPTAKPPAFHVDGFVVYTDSETYHGSIHPSQALQEYRRKTGQDSKMVVVGMDSNGFSIADPEDGGMLDVVGFDTAAPNIISEFIKGNL